MCGIAVCLSSDALLRTTFSRYALKLLQHRGPNENDHWEDEVVERVHTRLSIVDLSTAGHQPMRSPTGRYVITFNGEIYNHLDLRRRFLSDHNFIGHSDTETIAALYERIGVKMFQHLIGMWAMAIWDTTERKLFVSRDRYGQKPLYWYKSKKALFFSSEIKPLLKYYSTPFPNELALSEYLALGNYGDLFEKTFYQDIFQILPAHYFVFDHVGSLLKSEPYWKIEETPYRDRFPFDEKRSDEFRNLVFDAVESQLLADVQVGATLSGGLDSSIITSTIAALGRKNFPVFTAQFPGKYHETRYVRSIAKKWGNALEVIYTPVTELSLQDSLAGICLARLQPSAFYQNGFSKNIFRTAFKDILPKNILLRKDKIGFHTPVTELLLKDKEWVSAIIKDPSLSQWVNPAFMQVLMRRLEAHDLNVTTATFLFRVMSVHLWTRKFFKSKIRYPVYEV